MHEMKQIVYKRWNSRKRGVDRLDQYKNLAGEKAVRLVQHWGVSFQSRRDLPWFYETYRRLQEKGVRFPPADDETRTPIDTPAKTPSVLRNSVKKKDTIPTDVAASIKDCSSSMQLLQEMIDSKATPDLLHDIVEELRKNLKILRRQVDANLESENSLNAILSTMDKAEDLLKKSGCQAALRDDDAATGPSEQQHDEDASDEAYEADLLRRLEGPSSPSRSATSSRASLSSPPSAQNTDALRVRSHSNNPFDFFSDMVSTSSTSSSVSLKPSASSPAIVAAAVSPQPLQQSVSQPVLHSQMPASVSSWESFSQNPFAAAPAPQPYAAQPMQPQSHVVQPPIYAAQPPFQQMQPSPYVQQPYSPQQQYMVPQQQPVFNPFQGPMVPPQQQQQQQQQLPYQQPQPYTMMAPSPFAHFPQ